LEELGYLNKTGAKRTKAGFEATLYELSGKAVLALLLKSIDLEALLAGIDEPPAYAILADLLQALDT